MLAADVGGLAFHRDPQRNSAPIGVPHHPPSWLRRQHADGVLAQQAALRQITGDSRPGGLFVGNKDQSDAAIERSSAILKSTRRIDHRRYATLHVGRASSEQIR